MTKEVFTYRHRWRVGDLLMWDNRSTMHMVMADFTGRRVMNRVSVVGTPGALTARPGGRAGPPGSRLAVGAATVDG